MKNTTLDPTTCKPQDVPFYSAVVELVRELIPTIADDYRATDDPDDDAPGMQLTVASDAGLTDWSFQTGDNSFSGGCYHFPHWGVAYLSRESDPEETAQEMIEEILEALAWR